MKKKTLIIAAGLLVLAAGVFAQEAQAPQAPTQAPGQTPSPQNTQEMKDAKYTNDSVAHLSFVEGKAFVQRASDLGFEEAALNMPISEGDRIGTSEGRLEVHFGKGNYIRLDNDTKVDILNLPKKDDDVARIRVWSGNVFLVVATLQKEKGIELHTADSSFYVLERGIYRVDVRENRDTEMQVYQGLIEVAGEEGSTLLKASQKLEISEGRFTAKPSSFIPVADDSFDKFNESRTSVTGREYAKGRLPEELSDYEGDLDEYGDWTYLAPYGNVWRPNGVDEDWRPYYNGRWTWLPLSGWTWWPYEPWGWSTFHYGRWHWGFDLGWYWIPMNMWGPAWVDWWWDDFYFGWAPLSYWGYPGIILGGQYYGHYYGAYYPNGSRALTVVRREHLKDPHISANALRGDSLKGLNKMSLTSRNLSLRPAGTKISVEPMNGNRVMLRNDRSSGLSKDGRIGREAVGRTAGSAGATGPRAIRGPDSPAKTQGKSGTATKPQSVKSPSKGEKSSGSSRTGSSSGRNIRKKDGSAATADSSVGGYQSDPSIAGTGTRVGTSRNVNGYPSSPRIKGPASSYGSGSSGRGRTLSGAGSGYRPSSGSSVSRPSSGRTSGSSGRSGGSRVSSSGRSSGGSSRGSGSSSRSSGSSSRGSSSGSRGSSSGGSARRK